MVKVKVARVEDAYVKNGKRKRKLYATIAYYYPQYTLEEASKLKARDLFLLLETAQKIKAEEYINLTQIAIGPHTEKGKGAKKLIENYKNILKD